MVQKKHLIVCMGATASGKSEVAARLAKETGMDIFSADARQLYKELKKGTAPPSKDLQQHVSHHCVGTDSITRPLSAGQYAVACRAALKQYFAQKDYALLVGGSWLYVRAVCDGLVAIPKVKTTIRQKWRNRVATHQLTVLQRFVAQHDPLYYAKADVNNASRLARAAEIIESSGQTYSSFLQKPVQKPPFQSHYIILLRPRQELYKRIEERCLRMLSEGLLEEAKMLYQSSIACPHTIGYREFFEYFANKCTKDEAIRRFIQHSKQYAKRQLTAFRKVRNAQWFMAQDYEALRCYIQTKLAG